MRALTEQGLMKAIGVANFYEDRLVDLIERTGFTPAVNQIETHPYFQRADYQDLMNERGVQHQSWGGFAEGRNNIFSDPTLTEIGSAHGKSVAQVVLRWLTQRNVVAIPKSVRPERMAENIDIFDFTLTDDQMTRIVTLDTGATLFFDHRDPAMVAAIGGARIHDRRPEQRGTPRPAGPGRNSHPLLRARGRQSEEVSVRPTTRVAATGRPV